MSFKIYFNDQVLVYYFLLVIFLWEFNWLSSLACFKSKITLLFSCTKNWLCWTLQMYRNLSFLKEIKCFVIVLLIIKVKVIHTELPLNCFCSRSNFLKIQGILLYQKTSYTVFWMLHVKVLNYCNFINIANQIYPNTVFWLKRSNLLFYLVTFVLNLFTHCKRGQKSLK